MIAFLELAYWLQLTERVGPVIISISRVMNDIFTISINYILVLITFSTCILFVSRVQIYNFNNYTGTQYEDNDWKESDKEISFTDILVALFWQILNPGQADDDTFLSSSDFSAHLIIMLYAIYQILAVIVILNLLIALMNSTIQRIQDKQLLYWKFERASIWLDFINADQYHTVVPPFYVFGKLFHGVILLLICSSKLLKKCKKIVNPDLVLYRKKSCSKYKCKMNPEEQKKRKIHATVMRNVINRYLEKQKIIKKDEP